MTIVISPAWFEQVVFWNFLALGFGLLFTGVEIFIRQHRKSEMEIKLEATSFILLGIVELVFFVIMLVSILKI